MIFNRPATSTWQVELGIHLFFISVYYNANIENSDFKIFHIFNRGVNKNKIFFNGKDYERFVLNLYRINNEEKCLPVDENIYFKDDKRTKLVEILKWTLIPNHYHLLVVEKERGNATEFVKRIGNAYTKYINIKMNKSGYLFQNKAQMKEVIEEDYIKTVSKYIDLNPLEIVLRQSKNPSLNEKDTENAIIESFLEYQWSSFQDYTICDRYPNVVNHELFNEIYKTNREKYQEEIFDVARRRGTSI